MKSIIACLVGMLALSGVAHAQTESVETDDPKGYLEGVAQSAFGNVTSQSFGAEGGVYLGEKGAIFAEFGVVRDTAPKTIGPAALSIASYLTQVQTAAVSFSVRQPATFGEIGLRYAFTSEGSFRPYVLIGGGMARLKREVAFTVGGTDVTTTLGTYGVTLGSDLSGTVTKPMLTAGAGVAWHIGSRLIFDASYRFSRVLTDTTSTNLNRVGAGIGVLF